jgi:putative colanic acid biosynthesis UDP-glucose lipid carrier transferase
MAKLIGYNKQRPQNERAKMEAVKTMSNDNSIQYPSYSPLGRILSSDIIKTSFITMPLEGKLNRIMKRVVDILFSIVVIVGLLSWLIPLMTILIKLDSKGPVFFLQKRNKKNGELFTCIKFRSMIVNAEADTLPAKKNDKRITSLGKFLRSYYIDELPQFFNVLWGDMSLVGPRPHMVTDNIKYENEINDYFYRHKVKPGITGLAQVLGYVGPAEDIQQMKNRVQMDIFYTRHWSVKLDIIILFRTLFRAA